VLIFVIFVFYFSFVFHLFFSFIRSTYLQYFVAHTDVEAGGRVFAPVAIRQCSVGLFGATWSGQETGQHSSLQVRQNHTKQMKTIQNARIIF
jgi:ABC-type bacteriocin/lantibiotic exporter with double-glycine peptidase domain